MGLINFIKLAFSDNGSPSSSRILTAVSVLSVMVGWLYVCFHTGHLPDGAASTGAGALAVAPYALNQAANAFGKKNGDSQPVNPVKV